MTACQLKVPVKSACATPAAMKSEIPEPIPHLEMSSSMRNTMSAPRKSCEMTVHCARPRPISWMSRSSGSRYPNTCGTDSMRIIATTRIFWVPW